MAQRRPRGVRLHSAQPPADARVRIASDERYPWSFGGLTTERGRLPAGDYALLAGDRVLAVVERKTFDGLLTDFGQMDVLRQRLLELLVFEQHDTRGRSAVRGFAEPRQSPPLVGCLLCQGDRGPVRPFPTPARRVLLEPQDSGRLDAALFRRRVGDR
jgi:hypothetical protein